MAKLWLFMVIFGLTTGCQSETAKWEFASAQLQFEAGERDAAVQRMKNAVAESKDDPVLTFWLAQALSEMGDPESVRLCDQVLSKSTGSFPAEFRRNVQGLKSNCQVNSGDFDGALATYKLLLSGHVSRSDEELNGLAYHRALAGTELLLAEQNIEDAIGKLQAKSKWTAGQALSLTTKTVVANALLARILDRRKKQALRSLNQEIERLEIAEQRFQEIALARDELQVEFGFESNASSENVEELLDSNQSIVKANLVMLLVVRALIYQDLGDDAACNQDRFRLQQMGMNDETVLTHLPSHQACLELLDYSIMYLDTQGFIQGQLPGRKSESLENLSLAIDSIQTQRDALNSPLFNTSVYSVAKVLAMQATAKRTEAILRYHRMLTYGQQGREVAAESEKQIILKLGFEPNNRLN